MFGNFEPSSIALSLGPVQLHWYGLIVATAAVVAYSIVAKLAKSKNYDNKSIADLMFYMVVFGIVGARLYHVVNELPYYIGNPMEIFAIWHGGIAIHGGLFAGAVVLVWYCKKKQWNPWELADIASIGVIAAQAIGRWGNFFNQELYGRPTDLPWKISISLENRLVGFVHEQYYHPTFLYESLLNAALFGLLLWLFVKKNTPSGVIVITYLIGYSIIRFSMEMLRIDPTPIIAGVRLPQIASICIALLAGGLLYKRLTRS